MVGATATATTTATTITTHLVGTSDTNHTHDMESPSTPAPIPQTSRNFLCTSCQISFRDGTEQRSHMKEPWHVNNVRRRIEALPPVPKDEYEESDEEKSRKQGKGKKKVKKVVVVEVSSSSEAGDNASNHLSEPEAEKQIEDEDILASPYTCLFCPLTFPHSPSGLTSNLEHMSTTHAFSLPSATQIVDTTTFIAYLAIEIRVWNECLYCGAVKDSAEAVQSHMRDKAHCKLNLEREPELREFWEGGASPRSSRETSERSGSEDEAGVTIDQDGEMRFSSGKVVASKSKSASAKKRERRAAKRREQLLAPPSEPESESPSLSPGLDAATAASILALIPSSASPNTPPLPPPKPKHALTLRKSDNMSITGISEQARHALVLAEKKAQRSEAMAVRAREWVLNRGANLQKYDQIDTTGFKGKQNHKLLPR